MLTVNLEAEISNLKKKQESQNSNKITIRTHYPSTPAHHPNSCKLANAFDN